MKTHQWISVIITICLLGGILAGCSGNSPGNTSNTMGRYIEHEISLPADPGTLLDAKYNASGGLTYHSVDQNNKAMRYMLSASDEIGSEEVSWLSELIGTGMNIQNYSESENGTAYAIFSDSEGKTKLAVSIDGTTYNTIEVGEFENVLSFGRGGAVSIGGGAMQGGGTFRNGGGGFSGTAPAQGEISVESFAAAPGGNDTAVFSAESSDGDVVPPADGEALPREFLRSPDEPDAEGQDVDDLQPPIDGNSPSQNGGRNPASPSQSGGDRITRIEGGNGSVSINGSTMMISGIMALNDGFLVDFGSNGIYQYNSDGTLVRKYTDTMSSGMGMGMGMNLLGGGKVMAVYNGTLAISNSGNSEIYLYDLASGNKNDTIVCKGLGSDSIIGIDEQGIYVGGSDGIWRYNGTDWDLMVDGGLTSLMMPNISISELTGSPNGDYYAFLSDSSDVKLLRFTYDESIPAQPEHTLEIFSLSDNSTVRYAIGEFQSANPNVRVNLRVGMDDDSGATLEDVVRALNTEFLTGKGPDIILLDGLPINSYIEKGVLKDVTELVNRLSSEEGLMENLKTAYEKDGKIYGFPSRFSFPVMIGDQNLINGIPSLSNLSATVNDRKSEKEPTVLRTPDNLWQDEGVFMNYYEACVDNWTNDDGTIDEAALAEFLNDMMVLDSALKEIAPQNEGARGMFRRATFTMGGGIFEEMSMAAMDIKDGQALISAEKLSGIMNFMNIMMQFNDLSGMGMESLFGSNKYYPLGGIGIVSASKQQELAEDFITMLFSNTVQDKYLYDGFPVNRTSLESLVQQTIDDTNERMELDISGDMGFLEICDNLQNGVLVDDVIKEEVREQIPDIISGAISPQEAASKIVENTRLYLAE